MGRDRVRTVDSKTCRPTPRGRRRSCSPQRRLDAAEFGAVDDLFDAPSVRLAQSTEAVNTPAGAPLPTDIPGAAATERRLLQSLNFTADWAPRFDDVDGLGRSTFSTSAGLGVPPTLFGVPLLVTPRAAIHLVDGPGAIDAPPRLYDLELSLATFRQFSERWSGRASVSVGVYGDDESLGASDALRVSGFGVAIYQASPHLQWVFGAAYLNRDDIAVVPAVGLIYDRGGVRYELAMPRPRVLWRLPGSSGSDHRAVYVAGKLGGGAWAVERPSGDTDTLNLGRFGVLLGWQQTATDPASRASGPSRRVEIGYLFGRELEYADSGETLDLDDSLIARVGWSY